MKVEASRADIEQSATMLASIKQWECYRKLTMLSITMRTPMTASPIAMDIHGLQTTYQRQEGPRETAAVRAAQCEIQDMILAEVEQIAKRATDILRKHMPIPLEAEAPAKP